MWAQRSQVRPNHVLTPLTVIPLTVLTVLAWHHTPTTGPAALAAGATPRAPEGEQLLQCVSSVMARTRHGDDKPASTDRLM